MTYASRLSGTGSYLPQKCLTNHDLERMVDTSDSWIVERTGISQRHIAASHENTTDFALIAANRALEAAQMTPSDVNAIIFATVTPDRIMPSAACVLQAKLGCPPVMAFDVSAACSGFIYGLNIADSLIQTGQLKNVLVVGAETLSRIVDYKDRETCILFGDGAGAAVLSRCERTSNEKFLSFHLAANGGYGDLLTLENRANKMTEENSSDLPTDTGGPYVQMRGREIFRAAVTALGERCREALVTNQTRVSEIDWFIPHQANKRIIEAVGDQLGFRSEQVIMNLASVGNTSSASIPIALDEAIRDSRVRRGQTVLMAGFGAGLTSGSALLRY